MPQMKHPDGPRKITVSPDSVAMYASQGWVVVKPPAKKAPEKTTATKKAAGS